MGDMEARVRLNLLLDFYGPLLTEHRQEVMRLYCEEDLSQQEIADQMEITRQGVFDAINKARKQLVEYEDKLGLVARCLALTGEAERCLAELDTMHPLPEDEPAMDRARQALENILRIER